MTIEWHRDAAVASPALLTRIARSVPAVRITRDYADAILPFDEEIAQRRDGMRVPHAKNLLDKQIAATALIYDLTVVSRHVSDYEPTGVALLIPFT